MTQGNVLIWWKCSQFFNFVKKGASIIELINLYQMVKLASIPGHFWLQLPILHRNLWWRPKFHSGEHQAYSGQPSNQRRGYSLALSTRHCFSKSQHYAVWFINPWWCHELLDHVVLKSCPLRWTQSCGESSNGTSHHSSSRPCQDVDEQSRV